MIRPAKLIEIPEILDLTKACARYLCRQGIFQWNEEYPSREAFLVDVERGDLWILEEEKGLIGIIVVSELMDEVYRKVNWLSPNAKNRYIHRLAVHPNFQGRGYATKLMDFAEDKSRKEGARSIRLDTFSKNVRNQRFYENRGYRRLETISFPRQSPYPFYCYELLLSSPDESSTES